jgi:hypothetical protein
MKVRLALGLLTIAAVTPYPTSADGADQLPRREKLSCTALLTKIEQMSQHMKMKLKITPGSWGDLPAPLRKLPAGAEHCGAGNHGQVLIVSAAFGKDLEGHYAPLFAELGCKPLKCNVSSTTSCSCSGRGGAGTIGTDTASEHYVIMYSKPTK